MESLRRPRVLFLEARDAAGAPDVEPILQALAAAGFDVERGRLEGPTALEFALAREGWDVLVVQREFADSARRARVAVAETVADQASFLGALLKSMADGVVTWDAAGRIEFLNQSAERLFDTSGEEAVGGHIRTFFPDLAADAPDRALHETRALRPGGVSFPAEIAVTRMTGGDQTRFACTVRDVSARRELERQLRLAQRMESIGTLAGGIAHDFNNILTGVIVSAHYALRDAPPAIRADIEEIERQARRAAGLVRELLAFSRRQIMELRPTDLNACITQTVQFLERVIGEHIQLELRVEPRLRSVAADPTQIEQVLMNLCVNARDAMPDGGRLTLSTANVQLDDAFCRAHMAAHPGSYVRLSVADTGTGMDAETLQHVFEPFFTTKPVGKGTGLGLSVVHGIVEQHGGFLDVASERGKGTTFEVYFPAVPSAPAEASPLHSVRGGGETVLIAEDEPAVRAAVERTLRDHGYQVLAAADGEEALRLFEANRDRVDLVVLDAVMPRLHGRSVFEAVRRAKPSQKVIFVSGYGADKLDEEFLREERLVLVHKPFDVADLARRVREVLDLP